MFRFVVIVCAMFGAAGVVQRCSASASSPAFTVGGASPTWTVVVCLIVGVIAYRVTK